MGTKRVDCIPHPHLGARQLWASCPSSFWLRVSSPDGVRMRTRRERAGLGRHPTSTPSTLSSGGWFLKQASPAPTLRHRLQEHIPGWKREGLALTYPGLQKAGGGVRLKGPCPSQALGERGFVERSHSWAEAWPPHPRRAVGLRPGARVGGTLNGPLCPLTRALCGQARGFHTPAPRAPPACPQESSPAWSLWLRAGGAALTSTLSWCRSLSSLLYQPPLSGLAQPKPQRDRVLVLEACAPMGLTA